MPEVPTVDSDPAKVPELSPGGVSSVEDRLMLAELDKEVKGERYKEREFEQRHWLRYAAVGVILLVMVGMAWFLCKVPQGSHVALYISPIVSISTLSITLMISAFRGWRDGDEKTGSSLASDAMKASKFIP